MGAPSVLSTDSAMDKEGVSTPPCCHAHSSYCVGQSELKGEDVMFVEHRRIWPGSDLTTHSTFSTGSTIGSVGLGSGDLDSANIGNRWLPCDFPPSCPSCGTPTNTYSLYCVFDGHNGVHAAKMAGESVLTLIESRLPLGTPPPVDHPSYLQFREGIQLAMVEAVVEMNGLFAQRGIYAGCTCTVVLQQGWLVTAVGLGDSRAVLDTGFETISLSADHRVATHKGERRRVEAMGAIVAPLAMWGTGPADDYSNGVGPLRIWPGGLAISRAIGDFDVGEAVLPFPHVMQVMLPPSGGRLLVGSDGIWDAFDKMHRAGGMSRSWSTEAAPSRMISTIVRAFGGLKDDTTLIVADILPPNITFQQATAAAKKGNSMISGASSNGGGSNGGSGGGGGGGGFCFCFGGSGPAVIEESPSTRSGAAMDSSVRSVTSTGSASVRGGKPRCEILAEIDVAAIMGLMPEPSLVVPGWYTEEVGERLFRSAAEAADTWRVAHEKRYARPPATPTMPEATRPSKRKSHRKSVAFSAEAMDKEKAKTDTASAGAGTMRRNASMHFTNAVANTSDDFAAKFGHYGQADGPAFLSEPSVRAGRVYNSEASVRAGNAMGMRSTVKEDPSVRLRGSSLDGSVHMKASNVPDDQQLPAGLAPVRVVKRTGSGTGSSPIGMPSGRNSAKAPNDSVKEHMLRISDEGLTTIGE